MTNNEFEKRLSDIFQAGATGNFDMWNEARAALIEDKINSCEENRSLKERIKRADPFGPIIMADQCSWCGVDNLYDKKHRSDCEMFTEDGEVK